MECSKQVFGEWAIHTAHNIGFLLRSKGTPRNLNCLWLFCAQTEFSFIHHLVAVELVSLNSVTPNLINFSSQWHFKIPCSQTESSSETPPTIYRLASLKYILPARQQCVFSGIQFSWSLASSISLFAKGWHKLQATSYGWWVNHYYFCMWKHC